MILSLGLLILEDIQTPLDNTYTASPPPTLDKTLVVISLLLSFFNVRSHNNSRQYQIRISRQKFT